MNIFAVLPELPTKPFAHILPSLERHEISVADLLTIEAADVAKRAQIPTREVRKLTEAIVDALNSEYRLKGEATSESITDADSNVPHPTPLVKTGLDLVAQWRCISLLDDGVDSSLGGGIPTGYLTEITGESGVGKTQFLLTLLLSVQLPEPQGLGRSAIYISTEAPLQTSRLVQIVDAHPQLSNLDPSVKPSLSRIHSIKTPDLETQDHILRFQVPVAVRRHNVGLVIVDSITTNYRAELDRAGDGGRPGASMARRSAHLMRLGSLLRNLARSENLAVVVANQVADRFVLPQRSNVNLRPPSTMTSLNPQRGATMVTSPMPSQAAQHMASQPSSMATAPVDPVDHELDGPFTLEHQQCWFTGWGDQTRFADGLGLKTPSLGLVWSNEIACRIALVKRRLYRPSAALTGGNALETDRFRWSRHLKLVFSPWAPSMNGTKGLEFCIEAGGIRTVTREYEGQAPDRVEHTVASDSDN